MSRIVPFFFAFAISSALTPALVSAATLTITISDIRENDGQVMIQVASSEKEFQSDGGLNSKATLPQSARSSRRNDLSNQPP